MKHTKSAFLCLAMLALIVFKTQAQSKSPVGKNLHEIIGIYGDNFRRLTDAQGLHVLQYKWAVGTDTASDLLYLQGFTCIKKVSIRPLAQKTQYLDTLNHLTPAGFNSWRDKDSTFITLSTRDGLLDITSFSADYYKKIAH
jgi:hypothetical protein